MLTVKSAAGVAGVCLSVVYAWIQSGRLPHYRLGRPGFRGAIRIAEADLAAFLASLKQETRPEEKLPAPTKKKSTFRHLKIG